VELALSAAQSQVHASTAASLRYCSTICPLDVASSPVGDITFYEGDIADAALIDRIFAEEPNIHAVIHCAALIVVPDSVDEPLRYYEENVGKTIDLVGHLIRNGCQRMIFSSTAALYSPGAGFVVDETSAVEPASPYGRTKAMIESILADVCAVEDFRVLSLRYFNPIGADPRMRTGLQLPRPTHALGKMIEAIESGKPFAIAGTDYPTADGTPIRDYIHVWDLAQAHVAALAKFETILCFGQQTMVINLGTGCGTTVRELVAALNTVRGECKFTVLEGVAHSLEWASLRRTVLHD
jgi:UDP-glucose 4-epimerase